MKRKIATLRKVIANNLVDNGVFSKKSGKKVVILMYHGIDKVQNTTFNERFFSVANFEQQIAAFKKHFHILTYSDFINGNYSKSKTNVLLTFDDGYANNYKYALPVLEKYDAHALFFITGIGTVDKKILWADALDIVSHYAKEHTKVELNGQGFYLNNRVFINPDTNTTLAKYIQDSSKRGYAEKEELVAQLLNIYDVSRNNGFDDYWQLMTDEEIRKTAQSKNITIGSHGFYHNDLGSLANEDAVNEVMQSKQYLEGITQKEVSSIGFPDGSYTEALNESLSKAGIKQQFVVNYRYGDANKRSDTYDRFGLYPSMGNNNRLLYKILHA